MLPLRLAVATEHFRQPLRTGLQTASTLEADGVHLETRHQLNPNEFSATGGRQLLHMLEELRLSIASLKFPAKRTFYDEEHLEQRVETLREAMRFASRLRCKIVTSRVGRIPEGETQPKERQMLFEVLSDLAALGNHLGVTLAISPVGDAPETLRAFLSEITTGPLGVNFDVGGMVMSRHHPSEAFRELYSEVMHIVARDAVRDVDGAGLEVALGRGEVDWEEMLALVDDAKYSGWITIERTTGDDRIGDAKRAMTYLRTLATD